MFLLVNSLNGHIISLNTGKNFLWWLIKLMMWCTSVMLVAGTKSIIACTFCFMRDIPCPDTRCPKYYIWLLKNSHLDIFNFIPASQNFSNTNCIYFRCPSYVWLNINKLFIQKTQKLPKYLRNNSNTRLRKTLEPICTSLESPIRTNECSLWSWLWVNWNMMVSLPNVKYC